MVDIIRSRDNTWFQKQNHIRLPKNELTKASTLTDACLRATDADKTITRVLNPYAEWDLAWDVADSDGYIIDTGVGTLVDRSDSGTYDAVQSTGTDQAVITSDRLEFDGTSDYYPMNAAAALFNASAFEVQVKGRVKSIAAQTNFCTLRGETGTGTFAFYFLTNGNVRWRLQNAAGAIIDFVDDTGYTANTEFDYRFVFKDDLLKIYNNGTLINAGAQMRLSQGDITWSRFALGANITGAFAYNAFCPATVDYFKVRTL